MRQGFSTIAGEELSTVLFQSCLPGSLHEEDEDEPLSNVDNLEASLQRAGGPVTFYGYSGAGHWFFEPDVTQAYKQAAASLAWERTLAFLK